MIVGREQTTACGHERDRDEKQDAEIPRSAVRKADPRNACIRVRAQEPPCVNRRNGDAHDEENDADHEIHDLRIDHVAR